MPAPPQEPVFCADCGTEVAEGEYFLSPTRTPHCDRCVHPTRFDRFLRDKRVPMLALQVLILLGGLALLLDMVSAPTVP